MTRIATFGLIATLAAAAAPAPALASQTQPSAAPAAEPPAGEAGPAAAFDPSRSDEKAIQIADQVIAAMGGARTWESTRFLKFTFLVRQGDKKLSVRTHHWDKAAQRSRMEGPTRDGKPMVAVVDHVSKQGQASVDGQLLFEADAARYVDMAYKNLINDSYWLFMPFKLKDPGVRLRYEGEVKAGPVTYDRIVVTFQDGTGLTSKDRYTLYVNRKDHMIERWSYVLEGQGASASPTAWQWVDWTTVGGLKVSTRRTQDGGEVDIVLEDVQIFDTLPDTVFTSASPVGGPGETPPAAETPVIP